MVEGAELIILHTTKFSDTAVVVHALSKEYGRRSFLVRKPRMAMLLPMNIVEAQVSENPRSTLLSAKGFASVFPLEGIRGNIYKNAITLFLCEVVFKALKDGANEEGLYQWMRSEILLLDALEANFSNFHLHFLLGLASHLGFAPQREDIMPFTDGHFEQISALMTLPFPQAMLLPLSGELRNDIAAELLRYIEFHSEGAMNINSLRVLRELFA